VRVDSGSPTGRVFVEGPVDAEHLLVPGRQAEDAEDSALLNDADLNVGLVVESGAFVELGAFDEQGTHSLIGQDRRFRFGHLLPGAMEMSNYSAIQGALAFFRSGVLRKWLLGHRVDLRKSLIGRPHGFNPFLRRQVQASSQIHDSADDGRPFDVPPWQAGPLKGTNRIAFPEIDAGAKPVVGLFADQKLRTAQKNLGGLDAAAVIGKNKIIQTGGTPSLACRLYRSSHLS
jgi:hypothetical protein